jgi:UrcA family protein
MRVNVLVRYGTLVSLAACASGVVMAQQSAPLPEVRIQATEVAKQQVGVQTSGRPMEEKAELTMVVSYADLSLTTNSGQALLRDRVASAAREACKRVNATFPMSSRPSEDQCVSNAIRDAAPEIDAAIAAANAPKQ